ncbi:Cloroperoxidase [Hyaloscypha variabilis]
MRVLVGLVALAGSGLAFPFAAKQEGIKNGHIIRRQQSGGYQPGGPGTCPFNPNHDYPVPVSDQFPYNGAKGGGPGKGGGGYLVPAPGDTDHQFIAPTDQDIRGPCPGLNAAANYGFIARDGITNYTELTDAIQNMYNVGYDLANFLATISIIVADGDLITTKTTGGTFDLDGLADYRYQRYVQSRQENPEMFFGPLGLFQYGAASFVYELMPSGSDNYVPTLANTASFFGAQQLSDGTWTHVPEQIPANWTSRVTPYSLLDVSAQIGEMYLKHPVGFGGNAGDAFVSLGFPPYIIGGNLMAATPSDYACLLYQLVSGPIPSSLNGVVMPTVEALEFVLTLIGGEAFTNLGCAAPLTK